MTTIRPDPKQLHRRRVRFRIFGPVILAGLGLLVFVALILVGYASGGLEEQQVGVIAGILATLFITFPLVLLCLIPYVALAALAVGAGRAHAGVAGPIRTVRNLTHSIALTVDKNAPRVAAPTTAFNVRFTRWEQRLLNLVGLDALPDSTTGDDSPAKNIEQD